MEEVKVNAHVKEDVQTPKEPSIEDRFNAVVAQVEAYKNEYAKVVAQNTQLRKNMEYMSMDITHRTLDAAFKVLDHAKYFPEEFVNSIATGIMKVLEPTEEIAKEE